MHSSSHSRICLERGNGNLQTTCCQSVENLAILAGDETGEKDPEVADLLGFARAVVHSVQSFPTEQRPLVRLAIMECIADMRKTFTFDQAALGEADNVVVDDDDDDDVLISE
ncbi:unnamed protein product [Gongylonema pulchrum]|uniref:Importin-5 n=1 Tax=Gongylonema pulchrum TaxID=637853 RepID=A0A183DLJ1_9BILA|nr:unnamed protein product [Gongylonema pulchrum]